MLNEKPKFSQAQKAALNGKTEMTEELFGQCLEIYYERYEMKEFFALWNRYPHYAQAYQDQVDKELADPNSPEHIWEEQHWQEVKAKLLADFGEEWLTMHLTHT